MTLTLKGVLLLIAAIIFFLDFLLGWVGAYEPYRYRAWSLAWFLMATAWVLWSAGQ